MAPMEVKQRWKEYIKKFYDVKEILKVLGIDKEELEKDYRYIGSGLLVLESEINTALQQIKNNKAE